jgi:hypothetical protein
MPDEVEEFLRRVAQMRAQAQAQSEQRPAPPKQTPPKQKQPKQQRTKPPPRLVPARQEAAPSTTPAQAEVVDAELTENSDRVGRLVARDLSGAEEIAEHTRRMGAEAAAANDKMQAHLHQVFDHQLGRLKSSSVETALIETERSATQLSLDKIIQLLRSPGSIRDAIVMAEVLKRPDF